MDFMGAGEGGVLGLRDPHVLRLAADSDRVLVSQDRKTMPRQFVRFLESRPSPGLIILSQEVDVGAAIEDLFLVWAATEASEWINGVGYLPL